jgi:hypothetical protein
MNALTNAAIGLSRQPRTTLHRLVAFVCPLLSVVAAQAELAMFDVDPTRSQIQLTGVVAGSPFTEQNPGSLSNAFTGTILVDLTDTHIRFPGGSLIRAQETQSYQPAVGGASGSAPAAFGAKATVKVVIFSAAANAAARNVAFDMESLALAKTGDTFDARGISFRVPESAGTQLDYRTSGAFTLFGSESVTGLAVNKGQAGSLGPDNGVETLSIPFDASYVFELADTGSAEMKFSGRIVATRRAGPVVPPEVTLTRPATPDVPLTLNWPINFKLQRATTLTPPDWKDVDATPPLQVPMAKPGEFFRIIPR